MISSDFGRKARRGVRIALLATSLLAATPALAQLTTSTIRGLVTNVNAPAAGTVVAAVNVDTNAVTKTTAGPDGSYSLTGLRPGTYNISTGTAGGEGKRVPSGVGEPATLDLNPAAPAAARPAGAAATAGAGGAIVVTGRRLVETKTSEVATNVSRDQIENLP